MYDDDQILIIYSWILVLLVQDEDNQKSIKIKDSTTFLHANFKEGYVPEKECSSQAFN